MGTKSTKQQQKEVLEEHTFPTKWNSVYEEIKFVCESGKVLCAFCSYPIGDFKVTSNTLGLQNKPWVTVKDNTPQNFIFKGVCIHPSQQKPLCPPPLCKSVIRLANWRQFSDVHIDKYFALVKASRIMCHCSGMDVTILHSGQISMLTHFLPFVPKRLIMAKEYYQTDKATVCFKLRYEAVYMEYGDVVEDKPVDWKVKIGDKEPVKLETVEEIIATKAKLTGKEIYFPVPQEWRYQKIYLIAYIEKDPTVPEVWSKEIFVKDHIVAAFFRIQHKKPLFRKIEKVDQAGGTLNFLEATPVHHHQGMYKDGDLLYITGSTGWVPSYVYKIRTDEDNRYHHFDTLRLNGNMRPYKHPGGLQSANGILAVGIEKYFPVLGTHTIKDSVICFFDINDKYKELDNLRLQVKDFASAVGIVYWKDRWIVASRGDGQDVSFYSFENENQDTNLKSFDKAAKVAEFQNLNLFLDENEDIYLFGMGKSKMGGVDTCRIYKVTLTEGTEESLMKLEKFEAVWIDNDGYISSDDHLGYYINGKEFTCENGTSFHWASCVHVQRQKTGIPDLDDIRKGQPDFIGNEDTGFLGKLTVFTVEGTVSSERTIHYDPGKNFDEYMEYQDYLEELMREGEEIDWDEVQKGGSDILNKRTVFINPIIKCNTFEEEK